MMSVEDFFHAIRTNNIAEIRHILGNGFPLDTNHPDLEYSGLHHAVRHSSNEVVHELLLRGAHVDATDSHGDSALIYAASVRDAPLVHLLINYSANVNHRNHDGRTALMESSYGKVVRRLLREGAAVNIVDNFGDTALITAAIIDNAVMVDLLLSNGANVNHSNSLGRTALMNCSSIKVAKMLLMAGANVNATNTNGESVLMVAAMNEDVRMVDLLLDHGANINHQDNYWRTALMEASERDSEPTLARLLERGANTKLRNQVGETARDMADRKKKTRAVAMIEEAEKCQSLQRLSALAAADSLHRPMNEAGWRSLGTAPRLVRKLKFEEPS